VRFRAVRASIVVRKVNAVGFVNIGVFLVWVIVLATVLLRFCEAHLRSPATESELRWASAVGDTRRDQMAA
jgi:hypothetical protein